jgi:glycosyltransferase involved in cell wall biosynthesis
MKILYIKSNMHKKNHHALSNYKNIDFTIINFVSDFYKMDISSFDAVISPCEPINVSLYPNTKFIFGPHFSIFPDKKITHIKGSNSVFNLLSDWVVNIWKKYYISYNLKLIKIPFGVDTEKFHPNKPILEREKVFIYFKNRNPNDLKMVETFLTMKNYEYKIFSYKNKYDEQEYLDYLQNSKFGIWLGCHESQGFALQEALSCNVPLLVWNVKSMNEEYGCNYHDWAATSIPYWDKKCGEFFYNYEELDNIYNIFINNLKIYNPREFIINNLSFEVCENRLIEFIQSM